MVCPLKAHKDINYDNQLQKPENQNLDLVPTTTHYFNLGNTGGLLLRIFCLPENRARRTHAKTQSTFKNVC